MEDKYESAVMTNPIALNMRESEGTLLIRIRLGKDMPDDMKEHGNEDEITKTAKGLAKDGGFAGYMSIEVTMKVGDLTENEIMNCSPDDYLQHGVIAGILRALANGLHSDRGTSVQYAIEAASDTAEKARSCVNAENLMERVELAMSKPEGNA